jgi:hypothetical protein
MMDGKKLVQQEALRAFFADLANIRPVKGLAANEIDQVVDRFRTELIAMLRGAPLTVINKIRAIPREALLEKLTLRQRQFKELLDDVLGTALSGRPAVPIGADVIHPVKLETVLRRSGERVLLERRSAEVEDLTAAALLDVTATEGRFPFGICRQRDCRRVFARTVRGRPQKYCSPTCKGRGVPSAAKRAEYVKNYRKRKREEEIRRARSVFRQCRNRSDAFRRLKKIFPGRPAKSILFLMRLAQARKRHSRGRSRSAARR